MLQILANSTINQWITRQQRANSHSTRKLTLKRMVVSLQKLHCGQTAMHKGEKEVPLPPKQQSTEDRAHNKRAVDNATTKLILKRMVVSLPKLLWANCNAQNKRGKERKRFLRHQSNNQPKTGHTTKEPSTTQPQN